MPTFLLCFSHSLLPWVSGTYSAKKANRENRPIAPRPLKEQRACGINQNAKHNNKIPWEREPCDCVPACTPLGDSGRGARPTAARGLLSFSPASPLPMSPIHSPLRELINIRREPWETGGKRGRAEGKGKGARAGDAGPHDAASRGTVGRRMAIL